MPEWHFEINLIHYGPSETRWDVAPDKDVAGLADQIKIIDSPEFEEYVDEYLQKCFPKKFVPKSNR